MRLTAKVGRGRGNVLGVAQSESVPAPIFGWNARDPWANMDPRFAIILDNWFPRAGDVMQRRGMISHTTGFPSAVETLASYNGPTTQKLFAIAGGSIYDSTIAGAIGAPVVSGLSNSRWQHENFTTPGGNFMYLVNGVDNARLYNGTTFTTITGVSSPAITGVSTDKFVHVNSFKRRLWFVEKDSLTVWYLPVNSIGGAASPLYLGALAKYGGYLVAMATWTIDAGEGADDYAVFITSEGEYIVYKGTDPDDPGAWGLTGVWKLGAPIGRRCYRKIAGDITIITKEGLLPLSKALVSGRVDPRIALTDNIQQAMSQATVSYGNNFGWEVQFFPPANMVLMNVPIGDDLQQQYVMNSITGAWCRFTGWFANCWEVFGEELYFGSSTFVSKAWSSNFDDGNNIDSDVLQAYNYFGERGRLKRWTMLRPTFQAFSPPSISIGLNVDFSQNADLSTPTFTPTGVALWGSAIWGSSLWAATQIINDWQGAEALGYCAGLRMLSSSGGQDVSWFSTDFVYENGKVL